MKFANFLVLFICVLTLLISHCLAQTKINNIDFCNIYSLAEDYNEKLIRTKVILVYSSDPRVDGGDNYFYSTRCNSRDFFALAELTIPIRLIKQDYEYVLKC